MAGNFIPRKTAPSTSDKNWIHTSKGGYNECILIGGGSCIPNCVGYAWGRWRELLGARPNLSRGNAEIWFGNTGDGYRRSKEPSLGAVICWSKGKVGVSSDGAGHVAIVEEILPNGDIVTSNSGYKSKRFWTQTFPKSTGYAMKGYNFQGFIHLPNATPVTTTAPPKVVTPNAKVPYTIRITCDVLNIRSGPGTSNKITGSIKDKKLYTIVEESSVNGTMWGRLKSGAGWICLSYTKKS